MAIIQSGATADLWTINPISNAGRVTLYDIDGNPLMGVNTISLLNQTLDALNETATINLTGQANCSVQTFGTTGTLTISFEATIDGTNWFSVSGILVSTGAIVSSTTGDGVWVINTSGYKGVRCKVTAFTSGQTQASMIADLEEHSVPIAGVITVNIGTTGGLALDTTLDNLTITQGTALGSNTLAMMGGSVTTASPSYTNGTINALSLTTAGALRIDGSAVVQPVSGTVTANAGTGNFNVVGTGTAGTAATGVITVQGIAGGVSLPVTVSGTVTTQDTTSLVDNAVFTDGTSRVMPAGFYFDETAGTALTENDIAVGRIDVKRAQVHVLEDGTTRGTRNTIKAASTAAVAGDTALVVAISPNNTIVTSNAAVSATGASPPASATYIGGSVTTAAPSYTNATMNALSLTTAGALRIDGSAVTQPISAASLPLPTGAATETTLGGVLTTTAFQARINTLGQKTMANSTPVVLASDQSAIPITDNGGSLTIDNAILSVVGGGTEATAQRVTIANDSTGVLSVDDNGGSLTIDGTVTANIGTTNGLALDASITAQSVVDNAAFTDGTTRVQPVGYIFDETAGTALTENDAAAARIDSKRAQIHVIEDGTTRGTRATVKAASTAPVAGDTALVVSISPNTPFASDSTLVAQTMVDNAGFTDGTTRIQPVGFIFDETAGTALTENDGAAARIDSKRAIINVLEDGTTRGTRATIKPASTAAVAADTSLVVTVSPNYPPDTVATGNLTALNQTLAIATAGKYTVGANITGTWVGTIVTEGSVDGGVTWFVVRSANKSTNDIVFSYAANDNFEFYSHGGCTNVRVRMSAYTSGTASIAMAGTSTAQDSLLNYSGTDGDGAPPLRHLSMLQFDSAGTPRLAKCTNATPNGTEYATIVRAIPSSSNVKTYSAAATAFAPPATPTDIFTITGSATTTVRIRRIALSGTQTTTTQRDVLLIKRSTADTGGTSTLLTNIAHDSTNAAATATARSYTANPTLGTAVGTVRSRKVFIATTTTNSDETVFDFGVSNSQPIVLRGTGEVLAINLNSVTSAGNSFDVTVEWTEE